MTRRKRGRTRLSDQDIVDLLPDAFRLLGRSMPTTPEEVARMEAALEKEHVQHFGDSGEDGDGEGNNS